ncbi:MAG: transposase [Hydrogenophaga sp.]|jgi:putative transposase|uniref:transposase n=1 Tax=Hydrogenophaga sp. TaxID=1904254 RepID=UPI00260424FE|nr:transposase [Hydrogenophaga sp.]MCV0440536.1 transposase [Hydrogenophaga sp.]
MGAQAHPAERIVHALASAQTLGVAQAARVHGVNVSTVYAWRRRFGGMSAAMIERVRGLEAENVRLMNAVAALEQALHELRNAAAPADAPVFGRRH